MEINVNAFSTSVDLCRLLIILANSLDPDKIHTKHILWVWIRQLSWKLKLNVKQILNAMNNEIYTLFIFWYLMPRSHIHGSRRRFHYRSNPTDDPGNDNFRSPIPMFNASTTTYDNGCNTEIYGLIRIATDDAGSYLWLILRQIRECVTWALYIYRRSKRFSP